MFSSFRYLTENGIKDCREGNSGKLDDVIRAAMDVSSLFLSLFGFIYEVSDKLDIVALNAPCSEVSRVL